jgi:hypothetical protein
MYHLSFQRTTLRCPVRHPAARVVTCLLPRAARLARHRVLRSILAGMDRPDRSDRPGAMPALVAALWGLAEATVFFIVPDVWISFMALRGRRAGLSAVAGALAGAVAGGLAMAALARRDPAFALGLVDAVPGVTPAILARAADLAAAPQPWGMIAGALSGVPYKLFAVLLAGDMAPAGFALASLAARAPRFLLILALVWLVVRLLLPRAPAGVRRRVLLAVWVVFYAGFFAVVGV